MATPTHRLEKKQMSTETKTYTSTIKDSGSDYELTVVMDKVRGRHEVTEVYVKSVDGGAAVTQKLLRNISIANAVRAIQSREGTTESVTGSNYDLSPLTDSKWTGSEEQLRLVAMMYRDAYKAHVPVQGYVASRVNRPVSSVNRWIRLAREGGYLGKADGTRGGEVVSA